MYGGVVAEVFVKETTINAGTTQSAEVRASCSKVRG
jgi:hypothetical protein